jgi:hypothetical protein
VLEHHPDRPLTYFLRKPCQFVHDPILSNDGVSSKPGAIQYGIVERLSPRPEEAEFNAMLEEKVGTIVTKLMGQGKEKGRGK